MREHMVKFGLSVEVIECAAVDDMSVVTTDGDNGLFVTDFGRATVDDQNRISGKPNYCPLVNIDPSERTVDSFTNCVHCGLSTFVLISTNTPL